MSTTEDGYIGTATYCPEDNKLRLYPDSRLDAETYSRFKTAGFRWAPKQGIFVAPSWTTEREDLLLEYCGEIGDEDYSPEERAADRAERFSGYRENRRNEAGDYADTYEDGPRSFGHQSRERAERQAARHDRIRTKSVCQWSKAEYWQNRTEGVIANALHRSDPRTRRGRILVIEKAYRDHLKRIEQNTNGRNKLEKLLAENDEAAGAKWSEGLVYGSSKFQHPRNPEATGTLWELMKGEDPITWQDAIRMILGKRNPSEEGGTLYRWKQHYELRLAYENAMLENEGGKSSEIEMEIGGFIRYGQIHKINRSPVTGRIVSVQVWGLKGKHYKYDRETEPGLLTINIERLGTEIGYRPPTPEEIEAFHAARKEEKAEAKKTTPKAPSLINPTDEDAQRLQDLWNRRADANKTRTQYPYNLKKIEQTPRKMTQQEYSEYSKGAHSHFETEAICIDGFRKRTLYGEKVNEESRPICCKIRTAPYYRVVILTDKPQKPLPIDWQKAEESIPQDPFFDAYQKWVNKLSQEHGGVRFAHQIHSDDDRIRMITTTFEDKSRFHFKTGTEGEEHFSGYLKKKFDNWTKEQSVIHGELSGSSHHIGEDAQEEWIYFSFADGTSGSYTMHGINYITRPNAAPVPQKEESAESFVLSNN